MYPSYEDKSTGELLSILNDTHTEQALDSYIKTHTIADDRLSFHELFGSLLEQTKQKKADVIRDAQLDRTYGYQILSGTKKPGRDKIVMLCVAAGLSLQQTQRCLEAAREGILYSRSSRDSVIIYGIRQGLDVMRINEMLTDKKERILE